MGPRKLAAGSDLPFSPLQPETSTLSPHCLPHSSPGPCPQSPLPAPLLSHHLSLSHQLLRVRGASGPPAAHLLSAQLLPPSSACVCVCMCKGRRLRVRPPLFLPQESSLAHPALCVPSPPLCPTGLAVLVSSCISLFSPLSLCPSSDLDRDFWNNNESTVQQKWSSYPPKEFILNISPYAPYGDPRLSLK